MRPPTTPAVKKALDVLLKSIAGDNTPDFTLDILPTTDIKAIDQDVKRMLLAVQTLTSSAMDWVAGVNKHRNTLIPFSSLPSELATSIFEHALDARESEGSHRGRLHSLAKVSVHWRHRVLASPSLWTYIDIADGLDWVNLSLRKSLGAGLAIRAQSPTIHFLDGPPFIEAVARHAHRWTTLEVSLQDSTGDILLHLKHPLPSLQAMKISYSYMHFKKSIGFDGGPNLRSLTLEGVQLSRWDSGCFSHLHHLSMSDAGELGPRISEILSFLGLCPNLQTLTLRTLQELGESNPSSSSVVHYFSRLISLRLINLSPTAASRIIHSIDAPNLQTLRFTSRPDPELDSLGVWAALLDATGKEHSIISAVLNQLGPQDNIYIKAENDTWFNIHSPNTGGRLSVYISGKHVTQGLVESKSTIPVAKIRGPIHLSCNGASPMMNAEFLKHFPTMACLTITGEEHIILRVMELLGNVEEPEGGRRLDSSGITIRWVVLEQLRALDSMSGAMKRLNARRAEMIADGRLAPTVKGV